MEKMKKLACFVMGMIVVVMLGATFQALMINGSGECSQNVNFTGQVAIGNVSAVELSYLDGVPLPITTLLAAKQDTVTNNSVADGSVAGQLKIWDATAGTWDNAVLTQGSNVTITNNDGAITVAASSSIPYPGAGIAVSSGSAWGTSITDNSTNWDTAYTHSQLTTGNPHSVSATDVGLGNVANESKATMFTSPTFTTSANFDYATVSTVPYFDASKNLISSSVTPTELGYVSGVTSAIQTQLGGKVTGPASVTDSAVAQFDGTTGKLLKNGLSIGTSANNLVQLDGDAKLPAVDGSALTNIPSDFPAGTQGDILYYNGSDWVALGAGTSGYFLKTQGAAANPIWDSSTATASGKLLVEDSGYGLDNSSPGRGTVGTKAVSLEYAVAGSTYGATGNYSFACGSSATASGTDSFACGNSTASGEYSFACGSSATASGLYSTACGNTTTASGAGSTACGGNATASGEYSFAGGYLSISSHYGEAATASGKFSVISDCQRGSLQARIATSATDQTELFLDGTDDQLTLSDGDAYSCNVTVMGKQADGSCGTAIYHVLIKREGSTTSLTGSVQTILAWYGDAGLGTPTWTIAADDTNDALSIKMTAANATATRWTAVVKYVKLNY